MPVYHIETLRTTHGNWSIYQTVVRNWRLNFEIQVELVLIPLDDKDLRPEYPNGYIGDPSGTFTTDRRHQKKEYVSADHI